MSTPVKLPPLPGHPEPHAFRWTKLEEQAIRAYGEQCARTVQGVPPGSALVLVPVEPTPEMMAGPAKDRPGFSPFVAREVWQAMLAAAPAPAESLGDALAGTTAAVHVAAAAEEIARYVPKAASADRLRYECDAHAWSANTTQCPDCAKPAPPQAQQAAPTTLHLSDGAELVFDGVHWSLCREGEHIRYLNRFESEFIRAAQATPPQAQQADDIHDAHTWTEWEEAVLKIVREFSGYDGFDDADQGVDLPEEVRECLSQIAAERDRARAEVGVLKAAHGVPAGFVLVTQAAIRDMLTASDLLSARWKAQSKAVAQRLAEHVQEATERALAATPPAQAQQAARDPVTAYTNRGSGAAPSPTAGMSIEQRILHVGGRNNAAGYVEFGSTQAVSALVRQVLRDLSAPAPQSALTDERIEQAYQHLWRTKPEGFDFTGYAWVRLALQYAEQQATHAPIVVDLKDADLADLAPALGGVIVANPPAFKPLERSQVWHIMTKHYPLDSLLRENVDAFEACVRDVEKELGIGASNGSAS